MMLETSPRQHSSQAGGLVNLVEPLLLYVCRLNRIARSQGPLASTHTLMPIAGHSVSFDQTRAEVIRLLNVMKEDSAADVALARQFDQIEMPLIFFVDSVIAESQLSFRDRWHEDRLAAARGELAGDDKFFTMLDGCLAEATEEATEQLAIYFLCLGLGFTGKYVGDPLQIDTRMQRITNRIRRRWLNRDFEKRLCSQSYEHIDRSDLPKPSRESATRIIIIWSCGILALLACYIIFYRQSAGELNGLVESIETSLVAPAKFP